MVTNLNHENAERHIPSTCILRTKRPCHWENCSLRARPPVSLSSVPHIVLHDVYVPLLSLVITHPRRPDKELQVHTSLHPIGGEAPAYGGHVLR